MNIPGIVLTFDNLTGENVGPIRVLIIVFQFFLFRFVSKLEFLSDVEYIVQ